MFCFVSFFFQDQWYEFEWVLQVCQLRIDTNCFHHETNFRSSATIWISSFLALSRAQITFLIVLMLLCLLQDQLGIKVPKILAEEQVMPSSKSISSSELFRRDRKRLESCYQSNKQLLTLIALFTWFQRENDLNLLVRICNCDKTVDSHRNFGIVLGLLVILNRGNQSITEIQIFVCRLFLCCPATTPTSTTIRSGCVTSEYDGVAQLRRLCPTLKPASNGGLHGLGWGRDGP